jgi:hypothetical protein
MKVLESFRNIQLSESVALDNNGLPTFCVRVGSRVKLFRGESAFDNANRYYSDLYFERIYNS